MPQSQQRPTSASHATPDDFPLEELNKHRGRWVALSPDGRRLVTSSTILATLDALVLASGENPEEDLLELVPDGAFIASGLELS